MQINPSKTTDVGEFLVSGLSYRTGTGLRDTPLKTTSYVGNPVKSDGLVHHSSGRHTLLVRTMDFSGNIVIEGTLNKSPENATWSPVVLQDSVTGNTFLELDYIYHMAVPGNPSTGKPEAYNRFYIANGQYAWMRANISNIANGRVDSIKVAF
ncbi:Uncharacterised protein [uncultured archaeon]|nr:Uncharacterised protein [uncultured archaeon]